MVKNTKEVSRLNNCIVSKYPDIIGCAQDIEIKISNILDESLVNGDGVRTVIFMSGCNFRCNNCHNKDAQDFNFGVDYSLDEILNRIRKNLTMIDGITLSGGDPFASPNKLKMICFYVKKLFPNLTIWVYTGYKYDYLRNNFSEILNMIDILVDGEYIEELNDGTSKYRGSSNQRILDSKTGEVYNRGVYDNK